MKIHLFPSRTIRLSYPKPHNATGWAEVSKDGVNDYDPLSKAMWEDLGSRRGFTPIFHSSQAEAEAAVSKETGDGN